VSGVGLSIVYVELDWAPTSIATGNWSRNAWRSCASNPSRHDPANGSDHLDHGRDHADRDHQDSAFSLEVREIADFVMRPQLLTIPGVARSSHRRRVRQYRVVPILH